MIRFLMKVKRKFPGSGLEAQEFYSIDGDIIQLESCLNKGGHSEDSYEHHELIGVEVVA